MGALHRVVTFVGNVKFFRTAKNRVAEPARFFGDRCHFYRLYAFAVRIQIIRYRLFIALNNVHEAAGTDGSFDIAAFHSGGEIAGKGQVRDARSRYAREKYFLLIQRYEWCLIPSGN
ncbi:MULTISPECIES: hypothetical protein [Asticcacaulis]|uniref:hypothetical protein n=1 Tax=Asticcacaulis TaxID=76890 RepID=UPI001AE21BB3|nr:MULTISPECIES: hypothetical protein [Asticcacaulis]MBP2158070.1 hypothetical protein [Asticcacaulis solisilvae]MDR6799115.1 hypothetical protein [Asticcacaulis sp. BE141]